MHTTKDRQATHGLPQGKFRPQIPTRSNWDRLQRHGRVRHLGCGLQGSRSLSGGHSLREYVQNRHQAPPVSTIGYLQLINPSEGKQLDETTLAEMFDNPDGEPEEPRGTIQEPSTEELAFLEESINIQAPDP